MGVFGQRIDKSYRPVPFWSWNEALDTTETVRQVAMMDNAGIGGFFMHARGGLATPYMEDEWFANVEAAIKEAKKRHMHAWAYDENGWPSGFGAGKVNGLGEAYQQKYLRMSDQMPKEHLICKSGSHYFYYDVNPFYVDTLDPKVIAEFLKVAYEPYYERFGNEIEGFFTDEPQISRNGIPWSFTFERVYRERYDEDLLLHLEELYLPVGDYEQVRIRFWKMVTDLFSEAFCKQVGDWCRARGLKLTGHLVLEETLESQLITNGACMPHYEYFDIPGMDWLGRDIVPCLTPLQVSSVAQQLGKEAVISETFALCGHNVSFAELRGIYEWQMVHGINLLCPHLQGYTMRGIRKRDYPPAMYYQQPWWDQYEAFLKPLSRTGMLLQKGKAKAEVLLIHPQTSAWSLFDCGENRGLAELNAAFLEQIRILEEKHVPFHLGDETILERHGKVAGKTLIVGKQRYRCVIASCGTKYLPATERLLSEYRQHGGRICSVSEVLENPVCDHPEISYTCREGRYGRLHYFVNSSPETKTAKINVRGYRYDAVLGTKEVLSKEQTFAPWESLLVIEDLQAPVAKPITAPLLQQEQGAYQIRSMSENVLTLDRCDYYFNGELQEKNGYILNIMERAIARNEDLQIRQVFHVKANYVPKQMTLVCETPSQYEIRVNGQDIDRTEHGYFRDLSFRRLDISGLLTVGENTIVLESRYAPSPSFYAQMQRALQFESEKNMLTYEREMEAIYLVGDFGVSTPGTWISLPRHAVRYHGDFILDRRPRQINPQHIEQQGFPFFAGKMVLSCNVVLPKAVTCLQVKRYGVQSIKAVAGRAKQMLLSNDSCLLRGQTGAQELRMTLTNTLRNMLGPHHLAEGESYKTGPGQFYQEPCVWNPSPKDLWDEDYCFAETTLEIVSSKEE